MAHTPIELEVLLHHYYCPASWGSCHPDHRAAVEAMAYWESVGCLQDRGGNLFITDRGKAMVQLWLREKLPEHRVQWLDAQGLPIPLED